MGWFRNATSFGPVPLAQHVARFHARATVAFLILAVGCFGGIVKEHIDHDHAICAATNRSTHKVERLTDALAAPNVIPKNASPSVRAAIVATNRASRAKRDGFKQLAHRLLGPDGC